LWWKWLLFFFLLGIGVLEDTSEEASLAVDLFGNGEHNRLQSTILGLSNNLTTNTDNLGLASLDISLQVVVVVLLVHTSHQEIDITTNNINELIVEQSGSGGVETVDSSLVIDNDGRDHEAIQNLTLSLENRLHNLIDRLLESSKKVRLVADKLLSDFQVNGADRAILLLEDNIATITNDLGCTSLEVGLQVGVVSALVLLGHDDSNVLANEFLGDVSSKLLERRIAVLDDTLIVDGDESVQKHVKHGKDGLSLGRVLLIAGILRILRGSNEDTLTITTIHLHIAEHVEQVLLTADGDIITILVLVLHSHAHAELLLDDVTELRVSRVDGDADGANILAVDELEGHLGGLSAGVL
jgi:hypothetical protein